jgi:hypothetical protein
MSADAVADFIEVYDGALAREACAAIVRDLQASPVLQPGRIGSGVFPELKRSRDLALRGQPEWTSVETALNRAVFAGLLAYVRTYPQTLIAPLMLQQPGTDGVPHRLHADTLATMDDAALGPLVSACLRPGAINLQWYDADTGGYPYWHCELYPRDGSCETLHRHLLWTLYLNDGFEAGETEFLFQQRRIVPRTGSLLIAPTAFTHTHRGNAPRYGDKVIATSWILFQRAEQLFPTA